MSKTTKILAVGGAAIAAAVAVGAAAILSSSYRWNLPFDLPFRRW